MTVSSIERTAGPFTRNGAQVDYPFTMRVFADTDILATQTTAAGVVSTLVLGSDYTVAVNADQRTSPGGTLTMLDAGGVAGETLDFTTELEATQSARLTNAGGFYPEVVENALDKLTILLQQQGVFGLQSVRAPFPEVLVALPSALGRANTSLGFDADGQPTVLTPVSGSAADVLTRLADAVDAAKGAALVAYNSALTYPAGSVGAALHDAAFGTGVWITAYPGADPTGATGNDAAYALAIADLVALGGGPLFFPQGTFKFTAPITLPTLITLQGQGYNVTTLKRAFTGDFITSCGALSQLRDLAINGDTATHGAGRGALYPTGSYGCIHFGVNIYNFVEACVEFANNGGSTFKSFGSYYFTTSTVAAAIKMGTDVGANPRHFYGCESSGCILYDFGGANNTFVFGGYVGGFIFGAGCNKVLLHGLRIGNAVPNVVISGQSHELVGCSFGNAGTFTLDATTASVSVVSCEIASSLVSDLGTGNSVYLSGSCAYTPTWSGSTAAPDIGTGAGKDGVVTGLYTRHGNMISGFIELTLSNDAGAGTGLWTFSLPRADYSSYVQQCGNGMSQSTGTSRLLVSRVDPGTGNVQCFAQNGTALAQLGSASSAWASGDIVRFSFSYMTR